MGWDFFIGLLARPFSGRFWDGVVVGGVLAAWFVDVDDLEFSDRDLSRSIKAEVDSAPLTDT